MSDQKFYEMFPLGADATEYRKLTSDYVSVAEFDGEEVLVVDPEGIKQLSAQAFVDIAHYLRPGHLQQLRNILDDPDASDNDRFVALDLLKNANIASGGILPMCQDTENIPGEQPALFECCPPVDVPGGQYGQQPAGADRHLFDRRRCL